MRQQGRHLTGLVRLRDQRRCVFRHRLPVREYDVGEELAFESADARLDRFQLCLDAYSQCSPPLAAGLLPLLHTLFRSRVGVVPSVRGKLLGILRWQRQEEPEVTALGAEGNHRRRVAPAAHKLVRAIADQEALNLCSRLLDADIGISCVGHVGSVEDV